MEIDLSERAEGTEQPKDPPSRRPRPLRLLAPALGLCVAVGFIALLAYGLIARSPNTGIDDSLAQSRPFPAPAFRLAVLRRGSLGAALERRVAPALADGFVSPAELRGTSYVLNIWASWCVPCRDEAPELVREWRRVRPRGVLFVGLDMQDAPEDARAFMDHFRIDYLNVRDPTNATAHRYGATGVPETFFISARGAIVNHVIGVVTPRQLRDGIADAVAGRPQTARRGGAQRPAR
jgi:cytochrome c biogenesis protein CcmG/thiol:disulfide interchange protein DsbE